MLDREIDAIRRALRLWRRARYEAPSRDFITPLAARQRVSAAVAAYREKRDA